jgi:hypothetical protein
MDVIIQKREKNTCKNLFTKFITDKLGLTNNNIVIYDHIYVSVVNYIIWGYHCHQNINLLLAISNPDNNTFSIIPHFNQCLCMILPNLIFEGSKLRQYKKGQQSVLVIQIFLLANV